MMITLAIVLFMSGVIAQIVILTDKKFVLPRFTHTCRTCGYRLPPMAYPPAFYDCPECDRLFSVSDRF